MDKEGSELNVSRSSKPPGETISYVNDAFTYDDIKSENTNTGGAGLNNGKDDHHNDDEDTTARYSVPGDDDATVYYNPKKDGTGSANVDFTLPSGSNRERSKSLTPDAPYRGMGKEELLRFSSRPMWRNLRYACMSIVLTGWLALLITVVALVLTYPHCREPQRKDWWQKTVVYRVYIRSFKDTNQDGVGDLKGLESKLPYLKDTGVGTISLSPIYNLSSDASGDTQIYNHMAVDPVFGSLDDFKSLLNKTHVMGMHLILDFIPNHTSNDHPWFEASKESWDVKENEYRFYYVWQRGRGSNKLIPPNSWRSVYNCSAWEFDTKPENRHYLHHFTKEQPELNLRSQKVRKELEKILKFWLDIGVDGFYIRDADFLFEDYDLRDDEATENATIVPCNNKDSFPPYNAFNHTFTKGLSEVFDMLARWRAFLDNYGNKTNSYKMLIADVDASYDHVMKYYGIFNRDGVDFPLNKFSLELNPGGDGVDSMVHDWLSKMPPGRWANWMGGDDRSARLAERLGPEVSMPYLILTMLLPGTPYLYYGDEIGMLHSPVDTDTPAGGMEQVMRGPMLWDNTTNAGFCYCTKPWLEPYKGFKTKNVNVEAQRHDPYSMWHLFKNLTQVRRDNPAFEYGDYIRTLHDDQVFAFVREFDGEKGFLVALNFAKDKVKRHLTGTHDTIPGSGEIEIVSGKTSRQRGHNIGLDPLTLEPFQGVVVSWEYKPKEI